MLRPLIGLLAAALGSQAAEPADLIVHDARVWTADAEVPEAGWLAARDGIIVALGEGDGWRQHAGESTRLIDGDGRRVLPGLIDAHVHLGNAANDLRSLDLRPARSRDELLAMLRDYAAELPADGWVVAARWSAESWPDPTPPTAIEIDQAVGGRPAVLTRMDGHSLLASAAALERAGITRDGPPDPPGGTIGRDPQTGEPTGAVYEQAMDLVTRHVERPDVDFAALLRRAVAEANRHGVTSVGAIESIATTKTLADLDARGKLTLRTFVTLSEGGDTVESWRPTFDFAANNPRPSDRVRIVGVKAYMDGSLGSRTAWMTRPYDDNDQAADKAIDNAGFPLAMAAMGELEDWIKAAADRGLQPAVHAIGDEANRVLLDWYAGLDEATRERVRPRVEHAQHLRPADVARFGDLGVIPSMQPYHKADDGRYAQQRIGPERIETSYAFRDLIDSGATLAFGSDWPVVSADPFLGVAAAVNARTLDGETSVPSQSITIEEALLAFTRGAAFALHAEDQIGSLSVGKAADFVVLDRDVFAADPADLGDVGVAITVVGGETVYEAE